MESTTQIKIYVEERKTKDGRAFNVFRAITKNGRKITAKFTKDVKNVPTENSVITVLNTNAEINDSGEFPVLWVRAIEESKPMKELKNESNSKKLAEWF